MKTFLYSSILIVALTLGAVSFLSSGKDNGDLDIVAYIDDEPLYLGELKIQYDLIRTQNHQKANSDHVANRKKALDKSVRIKVQQMIAKQYGIADQIDYPHFLSEMNKENRKRTEAKEKNEVFYGPEKYDEATFLNHLFSNTVIQLKKYVKFDQNEDEILKMYEKKKEKSYKKHDYIKIGKIHIPFIDDQESVNDGMKEEASKTIQKIEASLKDGKTFEQLASAFNKSKKMDIQVMDDSTQRQDARINVELKDQALKLNVGEISEIFEFNGEFYLIYCIEREEGGYQAYEDVKDELILRYIDDMYESFVDEAVKKASVQVQEEVLNELNY